MTTSATPPAVTAGDTRPCNRCKEHEATIDLRGAERVCKSCFAYYVSTKAVKRLEVLQRETAAPRSSSGPQGQRRPQRYLVGLSCGPSSTALLHVLTENVRQQRARGQKAARFEYVAAHVVDDTLSPPPSSSSTAPAEDPTLLAYRACFPDASLLATPLSSALSLPTIDWTSLPSPSPDADQPPAHQLSSILQRLPSATSRADLRRLLTRHVLISLARSQGCDALLLGHSTTSLAELTLSETAKGRGFSVPWLVNDGPVPVPRSLDGDAATTTSPSTDLPASASPSLPIYSPLRELFRKELLTYLALAQTAPPLTDLVPSSSPSTSGGAVVSHRDQSIDDVLARYFGDVEASYPSVVANVVRTTGRLARRGRAGGDRDVCGLCGTGLDELGDARWRGEIGDRVEPGEGVEAEAGKKPKLCYGCERSTRG
ncbi:hypothetical protein F4818DRAFT_172129 [Hypoxylon cercidicola]|nr:hypothetical protein F4818DRAFT_172129 [Hypoxylon cercidicola]